MAKQNSIVPYRESVAKRRMAMVIWFAATRILVQGALQWSYHIWYSFKFVRHATVAFGALCACFALFSATQRPDVSLAQMPDAVLHYDTIMVIQPDGMVDVEVHPSTPDNIETFGPIAQERGKPVSDYDQTVQTYITRFAPLAVGEMRKFGIPASITLAQGILESRSGTSRLAVAANNHFGMKCFSRHCSKGHCMNFTDDSHKDFFRVYKTPWESYRAHSLLLNGRYAKLKKYGRNYRSWAYGLKRMGYATYNGYDSALIRVIEKYRLQRYDH